MRLPSPSPITLQFGATTAPYSPASPHEGVDFAYIPDNHIYAPFTGAVMLVPNNGNDGNGIYMQNGNQLHGMLHSSQYLVPNGATVTEGQPIGIMGDTGFAQGVHLHWCVKINNVFINPLTLVPQEGDMTLATKPQTDQLFGAYTGRLPNAADYDRWVGAPLDALVDWLYTLPEAQAYYQTVYAALTNPGNGTVLAPGLYKVK